MEEYPVEGQMTPDNVELIGRYFVCTVSNDNLFTDLSSVNEPIKEYAVEGTQA